MHSATALLIVVVWHCLTFTLETKLMGHLVNSKATKQENFHSKRKLRRNTRMKTPPYTQFY